MSLSHTSSMLSINGSERKLDNVNRKIAEHQLKPPIRGGLKKRYHPSRDSLRTTNGNNFEDDKSQFSCRTYEGNSVHTASQSALSTPIYRTPQQKFRLAISHSENLLSQITSPKITITDESVIPQGAEMCAFVEQQKACERKKNKQFRLEAFRLKTAQKAEFELRKIKQMQIQESAKKQLAELEKVLKLKAFAEEKRREAHASAKKMKVEQQVKKKKLVVLKRKPELKPLQQDDNDITEESDESQVAAKSPQKSKESTIVMFRRIDQTCLNKVGLPSKKAIGEDAISGLHDYSMLQRFRRSEDLNTVEPPIDNFFGTQETKDVQNIVINKDCFNIESKWWHEQGAGAANQSIQAKKEQSRKKIEQERYLKELRCIVDQKGGKMKNSEWKEEFFANIEQQIQSSNSDMYGNSNAYEKALGDILHCFNLFK